MRVCGSYRSIHEQFCKISNWEWLAGFAIAELLVAIELLVSMAPINDQEGRDCVCVYFAKTH